MEIVREVEGDEKDARHYKRLIKATGGVKRHNLQQHVCRHRPLMRDAPVPLCRTRPSVTQGNRCGFATGNTPNAASHRLWFK